MKFSATITLLLIACMANAQLLTWTPDFPGDGSSITVTVDANFGNKGLLNHTTTDVYVHTGVITNLSTSPTNWRYVKFNQNFNTPNPDLLAQSLGGNRWRITINNIRAYYGVPAGETIQRISILFRSGDGSRVQRNRDGSDMYIPVYSAGLQARITNPFKQPTFTGRSEPVITSIGQQLPIEAKASQSSNMRLTLNGNQIAAQSGVSTISANPTLSAAGNQRIIAEAETGGTTVRDTVDFFLPAATVVEALPAGVAANGATYHNGGTAATLVLYAPNKNNIVVIGDFNDWTPGLNHQMKRTPDGLRYWIRLEGLTPGTEYAYQYLIDGQLVVADYNAEKILDPWNDQSIPVATYPGLKPYPTGKTSDIVSVLEPGKAQYNWKNTNFQRPDKRNIIVYELLVRDFANPSNFQSVINAMPEIAGLGVNTIHLMPFTEFENNNSWGYNPSFMYAVDKAYGTENKLRELIDSAHGRGIAVILDMVLNHQFGQSPMVRMYWDEAVNKPAANSPWFNPDARHPFNVGFDMNHEAPATAEFVENVMRHWLVKYKLDGFRWDLSKGFTQRNTPVDVGAWNAYDQSRVNIWQRIYDQSQAIAPGCYMILEHLGNDDEEAELAKRGMLLWGKMTNEFNEASMGYLPNSNFQRAYHTTRWSAFGANNVPHLMSYAESHDEERLFYKNRRFGNTTGSSTPPWFHNTTSVGDAAIRMQQVGAFLFTIPGPKLIWQFGEYGYDASINMCENFTTPTGDGCRTAIKPLVTNMPNPHFSATVPGGGFTFLNYKTNAQRNSIRDMWSRIIRLRTADNGQYLNTFTTNNVNFNLNGAFKWQIIQSNELRVVVIGNFDVTQQSGTVTFPTTGNWQVYATNHTGNAAAFTSINGNLSATQMNVTTGSQTFNNLPPGRFFIFIDRPALLPITMLSFSAQRMPSFINLAWRTERERNAAGFEIERSFDGLTYEVIGQEVARNTPGTAVNSYQFADNDPTALKAPSRIFYRIRMVDKNGEYNYSVVQVVEPAGGTVKTSVYPNPVNSSSRVYIDLPQAGNYQIRVINGMGQVVGTVWNGYREKGVQNIPLNGGGFQTVKVANGAYYLRIEGAGTLQTIPLIKAD